MKLDGKPDFASLPARHVNILEVSIVGSSFENEDLGVDIFCETTCYHTARCATTTVC
jgi:hypothetical protein